MEKSILFDGLRFLQTNICRGQAVYIDSAQQISGKLMGYNKKRDTWLVRLDKPHDSQLYAISKQFYPMSDTAQL